MAFLWKNRCLAGYRTAKDGCARALGVMKKRSEAPEDWDALREKIIGLGERSVRKSYYPELQHQYAELRRFRQLLDQSSELILFFDVVRLYIVDANDTACQ